MRSGSVLFRRKGNLWKPVCLQYIEDVSGGECAYLEKLCASWRAQEIVVLKEIIPETGKNEQGG